MGQSRSPTSLPLGSLWGAASGGRVAPHTKRGAGLALPPARGSGGLPAGRRRPARPGKERGYPGSAPSPRPCLGGPGREDAPGSALRSGRAGAASAAAWSGWGCGEASWTCRGTGREAGREAPLPAPAPPRAGAPLSGFPADPGQRRRLSPFPVPLAARGAERDPPAGGRTRRFPAPRAHPRPARGPARRLGRALAPPGPGAPGRLQGRRPGWGDGLMLIRRGDDALTARRMPLCSTSQRHLLKDSKKPAEYFCSRVLLG